MMNNKFNPTDVNRIEYWLPQGNISKGRWQRWFPIRNQGEANKSLENVSDDTLEPEPEDKVREIIKERLLTRQKPEFTVAIDAVSIDESDFLPLSFLELGSKRSTAVCRIARYFSKDTFKELIEDIIQSPEAEKYNNRPVLEEIFAIPPQIASTIFQPGLEPLEALKEIEENLLVHLNPIAIGTGFLVGGTHLMTNHHVIDSVEEANDCVAQFNYVQEAIGANATILEYKLDPELLFVSNGSLDYTLVQLKTGLFKRQPGYIFGWLQLIENEVNVAPGIGEKLLNEWKNDNSLFDQEPRQRKIRGDSVFIIQHPKGQQKQFVQSNNYILDYPKGLLRDFLRYTTVSDYGSSGSPVFNANWDLIALHHAAIPKETDPNSDTVEIEAYQGVRICRIVADLKKQSYSQPKLRSFIEDFVVTSEQLNYFPFPSGLEFDGVGSYVSLDSSIAFATASFEDEIVRFWNRGGVELRSLENYASISKISVSSDGQLLACCLYDDVDETYFIKIWSFDGIELKTFKGNNSRFDILRFSPDGKTIAAYAGSTIFVWSLDGKNDTTSSTTTLEESKILDFSPDAKTLATVSNDDKTIKLCSLDGSVIQTLKGHTQGISAVKFSSDGQTVASASEDKTIKLWNVTTGKELTTIKAHEKLISMISFSPDGNKIASIAQNEAKLWSTNGDLIEKIPDYHNHVLYGGVSFSPDSQTLAVSSSDHQRGPAFIAMWNVTTGQKIKKISTLLMLSYGEATFSPNSQVFAFGGLSPVNSTFEFKSNIKFWIWHKKKVINFKTPADSVIFFPNSTQALALDTQLFSIEVWVNPYADGRVIQELPSWFYDKEPWEDNQFYIDIDKKGNIYIAGIDPKDSLGNPIPEYENITLPFGKFSYISVTYDGLCMTVYINGKKKKEVKIEESNSIILFKKMDKNIPCLLGSNVLIDYKVDASEVFVRTGIDDINTDNSNYGQQKFFKGIIAEVRFWEKARKQFEIKADMHRRLSGNEEGLVGYWRFEEGEGDKVYNLASKSDYGIVREAKWLRSSQFPALPLPCGLQFSEANHYIDCGNDKSLDTPNAITVEAWVKHQFGNCSIVSRGSEQERGYSLSWHDGKIRVMLRDKSCSEKAVIYTKDNAPTDRVWHHISFTWDIHSQEISIYIDGRRQETVMIAGRQKIIVFENQHRNIGLFKGSLEDMNSTLYIGRREKPDTYAKIAIAQVRLWKVTRTQNQIEANMSRRLEYLSKDQIEELRLVGYWRLDDGGEDNTQVRNLVSDKNHGTVYGAKWFPAPPSLETSPSEGKSDES